VFKCAAVHRLRTTALHPLTDTSVAHPVASTRTDRILIPKLQALLFLINFKSFKDDVPTADYIFGSH